MPTAERDHALPNALLLIESQHDPYDDSSSGTVSRFLQAATALAVDGAPVVLYLIDDGVDGARAPGQDLARLIDAGATVWVDRVSLADRSIPEQGLSPALEVVDMNRVAAMMFNRGVQVVWH